MSFFERTFITDGLRDLIRTAARRLSGEGGDPVVELQTGFGGGKTHSLIALYHLASGTLRLRGVNEALAEDDLSVPGGVRRAVFTGQWARPASVHKKKEGRRGPYHVGGDRLPVGRRRGVPDGGGRRPQRHQPRREPGGPVQDGYGPVMILIDEWVAYARNLPMKRR